MLNTGDKRGRNVQGKYMKALTTAYEELLFGSVQFIQMSLHIAIKEIQTANHSWYY